MEVLTFIPWYYYAAINQYESNLIDDKQLIHITIPDEKWYGLAPIREKKLMPVSSPCLVAWAWMGMGTGSQIPRILEILY